MFKVDLKGLSEYVDSMRQTIHKWNEKKWEIDSIATELKAFSGFETQIERLKKSYAEMDDIQSGLVKYQKVLDKVAGVYDLAEKRAIDEAEGTVYLGRRVNVESRHDIFDIDGIWTLKKEG